MTLDDYMHESLVACLYSQYDIPEEVLAWLNNETVKIITQAELDDIRQSTSTPGIAQTVDSAPREVPGKSPEIESITFVQVTFRG
jgi:hypothetical protein